MRKLILLSVILFSMLTLNSYSQKNTTPPEKYGMTLNVGGGLGYFGYVGGVLPVASLNFEFDVVKNFTLAPFIGVYSYHDLYYYRDPYLPHDDYRYYSYNVTVVPMGVKGTYYFDQLFHAGPKWDFYAAASVGFAYSHVVWESGYYGDRRVYKNGAPLYLDAHIGAEYHLNKKAGLFLDLSTRVSTFGLAIHF